MDAHIFEVDAHVLKWMPGSCVSRVAVEVDAHIFEVDAHVFEVDVVFRG